MRDRTIPSSPPVASLEAGCGGKCLASLSTSRQDGYWRKIVRNLLSIADVSGLKGEIFGRILRDLAENGYDASRFCYGVAEVGAPRFGFKLTILLGTIANR